MLRRVQAWLLIILICSTIFACTGKRPHTISLPPDQLRTAESVWRDFLARPAPPAVDADVRLGWDVLGNRGNVAGIMQLQQQALLKLSAIDPLGRAIFLLHTDGELLTFTDIRKQKVYRGSALSDYWQKYIPGEINNIEIFDLLAGRVPQNGFELVESRGDVDNQGFWYELQGEDASTRYILLDGSGQRMLNHLLIDQDGVTVLDVAYSGYQDGRAEMSWPTRVEARGRGFHGTYILTIKKIYSHNILPTSTFEPRYPPHFEVTTVE